jgi:hypothetical protein
MPVVTEKRPKGVGATMRVEKRSKDAPTGER